MALALLRAGHKKRRQSALLLVKGGAANAPTGPFQVPEMNGAVDATDVQYQWQRLVLLCHSFGHGHGAFEEAGVVPDGRGDEGAGGTRVWVDRDAASADAGAELTVEDAEDDAMGDDGARRWSSVDVGAEERKQVLVQKGVDPRLHRLSRLGIRRAAASRVSKFHAFITSKVLLPQPGKLDDRNVPGADTPLLRRNRLGRLHRALEIRREDELQCQLLSLGQVRGQPAGLEHAVRSQRRIPRPGIDASNVVDRLAMADQEEVHL